MCILKRIAITQSTKNTIHICWQTNNEVFRWIWSLIALFGSTTPIEKYEYCIGENAPTRLKTCMQVL